MKKIRVNNKNINLQQNSNNDFVNLVIPALVFLLMGFLFFLADIIFDIHYKTDNAIKLTVNTLLANLGGVLVVVAIGTLMLEYIGFIDYMRRRMRDVIIEDEYLNILTDDKKQKLKVKLEKLLLYPNATNVGQDSLFYVVQNGITPLLKDYFYKEYIITVDCSIDGELIRKKINKRMVLSRINNDEPEIKLEETLLDTSLKKINNLNYQDIYKVHKFIFNGSSYLDKVKLKYKDISDDKYDIRITCDIEETLKDIFVLKDTATLETKTETLVPSSDCNFIHRVHKPCYNYCIHFNYNSNDCIVMCEGFGFMDKSPNNRVVIRYYDNSIEIRFLNWILPGDGVIFTILPKSCIKT